VVDRDDREAEPKEEQLEDLDPEESGEDVKGGIPPRGKPLPPR
jgi:hypothetical protein